MPIVRRNPLSAPLNVRRGKPLQPTPAGDGLRPAGAREGWHPSAVELRGNTSLAKRTLQFPVRNHPQVTPQVTPQVNISKQILELCVEPKAKREIATACGFKDIKYFTQNFIAPLMQSGQLKMTIPDKPNSRNQKYITTSNK